MSTSILYHGWGLKGYHYVRTDYPQGQVIFTRPAGLRHLGLSGLRMSTADSPRRDGADLATGADRLMLKKFAKTLQTHFDGILAYYTYPISTGPLEGTNNKIKTMKRQAYGYRNTEFFMLKILGIHLAKYALVG